MFGQEAARKIAPAFFIIYLLNPFALQAFAIVDIDTSIYAPLILLAIWAPLRLVFAHAELRTARIGWRDYALIILILALCLWTKLTTTLSLPLVFVPILGVRLGLLRAIVVGVGITIASATLFLTTYWIYGRATGLDIDYTWRFLIQSAASKSGADGASISTFATLGGHLLDNAAGFARWGLSLAAVCAFAAGSELVFNVVKTDGVERARSIAALIILAYTTFVVGVYSLITLPFAGAPFKYIAPVWPLIALAAARAFHQLLSSTLRSDPARARIGVALGMVGFIVGSVYLRDAALLENDTQLWRGVGVLLAAAFAAALWTYLRSPDRPLFPAFRQFAAAVAIVVVAQGFGAAVYQARAGYATQYDYGQTGFDQTRDWLRENTTPDEVVMSMKDLGFAAGRRYLENYQYIYDKRYNLELLEGNVRDLGIRVFVFTEVRGQDRLALNSDLSHWIAQNTTRIAEFGNYVIYRKN